MKQSRALIDAILSSPSKAHGILSECLNPIVQSKLEEVKKRVAVTFCEGVPYNKLEMTYEETDNEYKVGHHPVYGKILKHRSTGETATFHAKHEYEKADALAAKYKGQLHKTLGGHKYVVGVHPLHPIEEEPMSGTPWLANDDDKPEARSYVNETGKVPGSTYDTTQPLESYKYSIDESNNVQKLGRLKRIRVRIRNGKIQRNKKVSTQQGFTLRGGKMVRMSAIERRHRKMGQRRGARKRRAERSRIRMKMRRSLRKRHSMGL